MPSTLPAARRPLPPKLSSRTPRIPRGAKKVERPVDATTTGVRNAEVTSELWGSDVRNPNPAIAAAGARWAGAKDIHCFGLPAGVGSVDTHHQSCWSIALCQLTSTSVDGMGPTLRNPRSDCLGPGSDLLAGPKMRADERGALSTTGPGASHGAGTAVRHSAPALWWERGRQAPPNDEACHWQKARLLFSEYAPGSITVFRKEEASEEETEKRCRIHQSDLEMSSLFYGVLH